MKNLNYLKLSAAKTGLLTSISSQCLIVLIAVFMFSSCKKDASSTNGDRDYGYAKIVIKCEKKCHVSYGTPDKMNEYDVEASTATYYQRYQRNYDLDINITPVDADQNIDLGVYSREEKQIFHNSILREANVTWNTKVVIP